MKAADVIIVGGGISGMACATHLVDAGASVCILEASDAVGGRIRTDHLDGFLLDRGFQVMPTAYPEAQRLLDYAALDLQAFYPGALVRLRGRFERIADPFRRPIDALRHLAAPVGTPADKIRLLGLRRRTRAGSIEGLFRRPQTTTLDHLRANGLSHDVIEHFLRPFLAGVFLERALETASGSFEFVWRMFSAGDTTLPRHGMGEIPAQLAARLPEGSIRTSERVAGVDARSVTLASGERLEAEVVVVATGGADAAGLAQEITPPRTHEARCFYFAAERSPLCEPILVLNGDDSGPITTLCVPSDVSPAYSPPGWALVSASVVDPSGVSHRGLAQAVRAQLVDWFGESADTWRLLRSYAIPEALPAYIPGAPVPSTQPARLASGVFVCGDHREHPSLNGALASARRAAELITSQ